tara:strand:- start:850 stop:1053 length:204 start_codon:yes stop_codon:yes gene_type:complete
MEGYRRITTSVNIAIAILVSFTPVNGGIFMGLDSLFFGPARVDNAVIDTIRIGCGSPFFVELQHRFT